MMFGSGYGYYSLGAMPVLTVIGVIAGLVIGILACVLVLPVKRRQELNPFFKKVHDFVQFKYLWIESIIKVIYIITTCVVTLVGFLLLFGPTFLLGLLLMFTGVILNRLLYEGILIIILILRNTQQINDKMSGNGQSTNESAGRQGETGTSYGQAYTGYDPYYHPAPEPQPEPEPKWRYCSQCGTRYDANKGGCPNGCE